MKRKKSELIPGIIAVLVIFITGMYFVVSSDFNPVQHYPITTMDDGWEVRYNGRRLAAGSIDDLYVKTPLVGDQYSISRTLEGDRIPGAAVYFRAFQSKVEAYVDGVLVYEQGADALNKRLMPGRTICFVPLPDKYIGKTLRIDITACENGAFTSLGPFKLGNEQDLFHDFVAGRQLAHLFGTFLTLFAFFQFLLLPYLLIRNTDMIRQFFSALLVLAAGTYILAFNNIFNIYVEKPEVNTFLEFLSIYGIPSAICGYLQFVLKGRTGKLYSLFTIIDFVLLGIVLTLHFTNVIHISQSLMPMYVLCVIEVIPFLLYLYRVFRDRKKTIRENWLDELSVYLPLMGMMSFALISFVDMGYFLYMQQVLRDEQGATIYLATFGGMILALSQIVSFMLQGVSFLRGENYRKRLLDAAHTDSETGFFNRSRFEQEMKDRKTIKGEYAILAVHIEHSAKDMSSLTDAFSGIMRECFPETAIINRIEDDEYVVIMDNVYEQEMSEFVEKLTERIKEYNESSKLRFDISYGAAMSSEGEVDRGAYSVYLIADQRMFHMMHQNSGERGVPVEA